MALLTILYEMCVVGNLYVALMKGKYLCYFTWKIVCTGFQHY